MPSKSPGSLTSPRNRALSIGTDPANFAENASGPYGSGAPNGQGGGGAYQSAVEGVPSPGSSVNPAPFKLGLTD